jgi:hypothetical protein
MVESKVFLVTGNEDLRNKNLLIENLLYLEKKRQENPLLIDLIPGNSCFSMECGEAAGKSKVHSPFEYFTDLEIPRITGEKLSSELTGKNNEELFAYEEAFTNTFILGAFPKESLRYYNCIDHIIFVVKNDFESSSYLFNFINDLYDQMVQKNICLLISGIKRIEDAAGFFVRLREEMKNLIDTGLSFDFLGALDFDVNKIAFSRKRKEPYLKIFEGDSLQGNIKYIHEKLQGLEYFKTESFFKAIADYGTGTENG